MKNKGKVAFGIIIILGAVVLLGLQSSGPRITRMLYENGQLDLLNKICGVKEAKSLDFYVGQMEEEFFGPVTSLGFGALFLLGCFKIWPVKGFYQLFFACLGYLILSRWAVLFYPPYGDTFTGPFSDAIWLLRHSFDYAGYIQQDSFTLGGPKVYPTSLYPTFLAVLMAICPSPKFFLVVTHLILFVMGALIIALFRDVLLKVFDEKRALLVSLLTLAHPLFQSMVELINMETACLFFAMLSVYYLADKRFFLATAMAALAMCVKAPGAIAFVVIFAAGIYLLFVEPKRKVGLTAMGWGTVGLGLGWLSAVGRKIMMVEEVTANEVKFLVGLRLLKMKSFFWIFLGLVIFVVLWWTIEGWVKARKGESIKSYLRERYVVFIMFTIASAWFLLYMNFSSLLYRYELLLIPFILFCVVYAASLLIRLPKFFNNGLIIILLVMFLGAYGLILKDNYYMPNGNIFERSLEYRNDLKLQMRLARDIEENFSEFTIGAPVIIAQALDFDEVGYVSEPIDVMIYGVKSPHETIRDFPGLKQLDLKKIVWVALNYEQQTKGMPYPIDPEDYVFKTIEVGNKSASYFFGGIAIEKRKTLIMMKMRGLI